MTPELRTGRHFSLKAKARTSQGRLRGLMRWQALYRKPHSAVAAWDHYKAATEEMQDDCRKSRYVGSSCRLRLQVATRPRRISFVLALWHAASCRFESSSFFSQAFEDRHFTEREISFEMLNEVRTHLINREWMR
jgi:hypothetical protein